MDEFKVKIFTAAERVERFLTNVLKTGKDKRTAYFLNARLQLLHSYWATYLKYHDELCEAVTAEQIKNDDYFKNDVFSKVECCYIDTSSWLHDQLQFFTSTTSEESRLNSTIRSTMTSAVKLPKINLPSFSGAYLDWPAFRDTYTSLIHENDSLPMVQKMHYLKSSLTGEASKLLQHLALTDANYSAAWKILSDRYDNMRMLVNSHLTALIHLTPMSSESASELRRVVDNFTQHVRALENLKRPVDSWNDWLVHFLSSKLDNSTRKDWETSLSSSAQIPLFQDLKSFLESRIHTLTAMKGPGPSRTLNKPAPAATTFKTTTKSFYSSSSNRCVLCQQRHFVMFCPQFRSKSVDGRIAFIDNKNLCFNCLRSNHNTSNCTSSKRCQICQNNHHTMLHKSNLPIVQPDIVTPDRSSSALNQVEPSGSTTCAMVTHANPKVQIASNVNSHLANNFQPTNSVLLATAVVLLRSSDGRLIKARALLDQGSESSFITTSLANYLRLPKWKVNISLNVVGAIESGVIKTCVIHDVISMVDPKCCYTVQSLVMPILSQPLPSGHIVRGDWPHISGLELADPEFATPSRIDLILGAAIYARIIRGEIREGDPDAPVAQLTSLGWILSGSAGENSMENTTVTTLHSSITDLDVYLRKFWEIEEPPKSCKLTQEEEECERFFAESHYRNNQGRYVVRLPLKESPLVLGQSKDIALSALKRLEHRFPEDQTLYESYSSFMEEYLRLNHMTKVHNPNDHTKANYFPHHAVVKMSSSTTKLRVVFNASQKTSTGISLNDILHTGPKLQKDIISILSKWRFFPFIFVADIEKMFRQILVDERDQDLQHILWRESPSQPVQDFRLCTVTYGTACAPYLACKTLQQLSVDYCREYPSAACILRDNVYVDDAFFGAFNMQTAINLRNEVRHLLSLGGFNLRKWISNVPDLIADIPEEDRELKTSVQVVKDPQIKALGINWSPITDQFSFLLNLPMTHTITKRTVLADVGRLYDPLGWLAPVIIKAKIFIQQLWLAKVQWDEPLPKDLTEYWVNFKQSLTLLQEIHVERWIGTSKESHIGWEIHGFSDASLQAYGAVVYLRVVHDFDNVQTSLLLAKTRVSPIKTVSLPRLELCGAALLAELVPYLQHELKLEDVPVYLWTDSTIVLAWLREHPSKWKVYVANRVAQIHLLIPSATWRHVRSSDNPADCISRGIPPEQLKDYNLWWSGPAWLKKNSSTWPVSTENPSNKMLHEELRPSATFMTTQQTADINFALLYRYSSLQRLLRITALCLRFVKNLSRPEDQRVTGPLGLEERNTALATWIKIIQQHSFPELNQLCNKQSLPSTSKLLKLHPLVDEQHILRVGGRLKESLLNYDEKHPIILPKDSYFTQLVIQHAHLSTLHGGVQLTLHHIRSKYWIINGRSKVRKLVRNCVICCRYRARTATQFMGDLPPDRVRPSKPFLATGVDYAGPFNITPIRRRGCKSTKSYVAVFICLVTRAIHLEMVMDLTSEAFVAAFRRFVSRRGNCSKLYSDNATYFVAADKQLSTNIKHLMKDTTIANALLDIGTEWKFMPPSAPHFGGIWEAGVRSFKHHLRRIVGDHILAVDEMLTLLTQIEACLNSRPMHALSDDPSDLSVITPGHFLVGEALCTIPTPSILHTPTAQLNRWQLVQHMYESLWKRWYKDYLQHLQIRGKWTQSQKPIQVGNLVLVKDDRLPPAKWLLGRVTEVHPGKDGHVRVVTLRHKDGFYKRPITKLCVLPVEGN